MSNLHAGLQDVAAKMYADGSIISAVCHGGAIFPGIKSPLTDKSIIAGRKVTGFTTKGEEEEGVLDTIKSWKRPTIEQAAADCGATYVSPPGPWDSFTQTDGRIVTGANPASAHATAEAAVKAFDALASIPRIDHDYAGGGQDYDMPVGHKGVMDGTKTAEH
jgi:D-lactate dehydratase